MGPLWALDGGQEPVHRLHLPSISLPHRVGDRANDSRHEHPSSGHGASAFPQIDSINEIACPMPRLPSPPAPLGVVRFADAPKSPVIRGENPSIIRIIPLSFRWAEGEAPDSRHF